MHHSLKRVLAFVAMSLLAAPLWAQSADLKSQAPSATVTIQADKILGPVNPLIFGHNLEACDNRGIFSTPLSAPRPDAGLVDRGQGTWDPAADAPVSDVVTRCRDLGVKMLRYPGGCLAHNYDWRKSVGPLSERPEWRFGLEEYLRFCRSIGAEPLITVSDYVLPAEEMPQHAADLVEYLNAPATPEHPWAMKRKAWGSPEPHGVKYFELGNESSHGNHQVIPKRCYTGEEYARYAVATAAAMRKVDPTIKIGINTVPGSGQDADNPWNLPVYRMAGPIADFVVIHLYAPGVADGASLDEVAGACMAIGDQFEDRMHQYRAQVKQSCGRDLPLAITEYNIGSTKPNPIPYRFSFVAGLMSADMVRIALKPENQILSANYWQMINGFWGIFSTGEKAQERGPYMLYRLWGNHFGTQLCAVQVAAPKAEYASGYRGVSPAAGDGSSGGKVADVELVPSGMDKLTSGTLRASQSADGTISLQLHDVAKEMYPSLFRAARPADAGSGALAYRLSYEGRFVADEPLKGKLTLGMGLCDLRGWEKTHAAVAVAGVPLDGTWKKLSGSLDLPPDSPGATVLARIENVVAPTRGRLEIRNVKVEILKPRTYPAYAEITASTSLSASGQTLYVILFNKNLSQPIETTLQVSGFEAASGKRWEVAAPLDAIAGVKESATAAPVKVMQNRATVVLPAHSMTAVELYRASPRAAAEPKQATYKVLFIGDSITRHGPKPSIKWDHLAGMAATSEDKDYAHLLMADIGKSLGGRQTVPMFGGVVGTYKDKLKYKDTYEQFAPDLVVVQLGEHEKSADGAEAAGQDCYALLSALKNLASKPMVLCTGHWQPSTYRAWHVDLDKAIEAACRRAEVPFVSVQAVAENPANHGWGEDNGVKWHPNDAGMRGYADALFAAWQAAKK